MGFELNMEYPVILSFHLHLPQKCCMHFSFPISANLVIFDLIIVVVFGKEYE
jgi:hypothetical protein